MISSSKCIVVLIPVWIKKVDLLNDIYPLQPLSHLLLSVLFDLCFCVLVIALFFH